MAFCTNCGNKIADDAKFCSGCGCPVGNSMENNSSRKTVYEGEIHKCPSCGAVLEPFALKCECGHELRGTTGSSSVARFSQRLEAAQSEKQRIEIIRTYPIPNTKEDIYDFMVVASTSFDARYYATHMDEEDISDAWHSKIEQCYEKAEMLIDKEDKVFKNIEKNIGKCCQMSIMLNRNLSAISITRIPN